MELETERLRLRRWRDDDLETLVRWNQDAELMRHMGRTWFSRAETEEMFAHFLAHWDEHGFGLLAVEEKESGALVGRSGLAYHRAWPHDPEVGWLIDGPWQGRGFAGEAGAACVRYGFETLGVERLVSICVEENVASRRVMEKLGFRLLTEVSDPVLGLPLWVHALERTAWTPG